MKGRLIAMTPVPNGRHFAHICEGTINFVDDRKKPKYGYLLNPVLYFGIDSFGNVVDVFVERDGICCTAEYDGGENIIEIDRELKDCAYLLKYDGPVESSIVILDPSNDKLVDEKSVRSFTFMYEA